VTSVDGDRFAETAQRCRRDGVHRCPKYEFLAVRPNVFTVTDYHGAE